jgi:hypothetical protein
MFVNISQPTNASQIKHFTLPLYSQSPKKSPSVMQVSQQPSPVKTWAVRIGVHVIIIIVLPLTCMHLARLAWRSSVSDSDGIVYLIDATDSTQLALSKEELDGLLNDETLLSSKPILILALESNASEGLQQQLNFQPAITNVCLRFAPAALEKINKD